MTAEEEKVKEVVSEMDAELVVLLNKKKQLEKVSAWEELRSLEQSFFFSAGIQRLIDMKTIYKFETMQMVWNLY